MLVTPWLSSELIREDFRRVLSFLLEILSDILRLIRLNLHHRDFTRNLQAPSLIKIDKNRNRKYDKTISKHEKTILSRIETDRDCTIKKSSD